MLDVVRKNKILKIIEAHEKILCKLCNLHSTSIRNWTRKGGVPRKLYWEIICNETGIPYNEFEQLMIARAKEQKTKIEEKKNYRETAISLLKPDSQQIQSATQSFLSKGGKIQRLSPQPNSKSLLSDATYFCFDDALSDIL